MYQSYDFRVDYFAHVRAFHLHEIYIISFPSAQALQFEDAVANGTIDPENKDQVKAFSLELGGCLKKCAKYVLYE